MKGNSSIKKDYVFLESKREFRIEQTAGIGHARLGRGCHRQAPFRGEPHRPPGPCCAGGDRCAGAGVAGDGRVGLEQQWGRAGPGVGLLRPGLRVSGPAFPPGLPRPG